jgi:hypothetical protein
MSENQPYDPGQSPVDQPAQPASWREERHHRREGGAWIWGVFLILLGTVFLLDNANIINLQNWWALFILLPAIGSFQTAWSQYVGAGRRLTANARGSLIGGFVITMVALVFLFDLSFGSLWPLFLILGGILLLVNALLPG